MGGVKFLLSVYLTLFLTWKVQCQSPPGVSGSYIAWGEIVETDAEIGMVFQISFEESYDVESQNTAFLLYLGGRNQTFVTNNASQTFLYVANEKETEMTCTETKEKEWFASDFTTGLVSYEGENGTVKFSLKHLINIPENHLQKDKRGIATTYRGIPAKSWTYEIKGIDSVDASRVTLTITAYWSDGSWNTSAGSHMIPLGFNVTRQGYENSYFINVFGFLPNAYDHKFFEPYQGIVCETRKSSMKFPNIENIRAISLHFETTLPGKNELRYTDMWFDPLNQLVRIDTEKRNEDKTSIQSDIAIGKMRIVYRWNYSEKSCTIIPFEKYINDEQNLIDVKRNLIGWQMGKIFGLNQTQYVYIGKTLKFGVPCHLFQGKRSDWTLENSTVDSLWEWCFNINMTDPNEAVVFLGNELALINANVKVLSGGSAGKRLNHHFYNVKAQDPKLLDATSFDISRCYKGKNKKRLQFYLDVTIGEDNRLVAENATGSISFLQKWKSTIYRFSGLPDYSLRVSDVRATIEDDKLYIKFSFLTVHEGLPQKLKDDPALGLSVYEAEKKLRDNINGGNVAISFQWTNGTETLRAVKYSVTSQIDEDFKPETLEPPPVTSPMETTQFIFTLRPEPSKKVTDHPGEDTSVTPLPDDGTTTPQDNKKKRVVKLTGHQPGAVAGVSIALLLIGISIGSAGTFYKFNGLPAFCKR